jgi:hypothetical protein
LVSERCFSWLGANAINQSNQVERDGGESGGARGRGHLMPALGESFAHQATNRVMLFWEQGTRFAFIVYLFLDNCSFENKPDLWQLCYAFQESVARRKDSALPSHG